MNALADIEARIDSLAATAPPAAAADALLGLGEEILEHWIRARGETPTAGKKEGFRLLALHRQGCKGDPSFNACRETCRELIYQRNLICADAAHAETGRRLVMMGMVARHLCLFVAGKLDVSALGEFCCSSRPLRANGG